jgi:hypothetical protein
MQSGCYHGQDWKCYTIGLGPRAVRYTTYGWGRGKCRQSLCITCQLTCWFQHNRKGWAILPQLDLKQLRRGKPDISWLMYSGIWRNSGTHLPNIRHHIPGDLIFKAGAVNISNSIEWFLMEIIFSRMACWTWDSHSRDYDGYCLLGYVKPSCTVLHGVTCLSPTLQTACCSCR